VDYIACPYWHDDESVRNYRRRKAIEYTSVLVKKGILCYSPLLYTDRFKNDNTKENYWLEHGRRMIDACDRVRVLCLEGWEESGGVKGEIERAQDLGLEIIYITKHSRLSFHGSRSLTCSKTREVIKLEIEKHQPDTVVTHGEPAGACELAREVARFEGIPLKLHHLQMKYLAGKFHHRSVAVLEDCDHAIFLHDGVSQGCSNELELARKMGIPYTYYVWEKGGLVQRDVESLAGQDITTDLLGDAYEPKLSQEIRKSPDYKKFVKAVLERDKYTCQFCGSREKYEVHHLVPYSKNNGLALDPSNGQTLCADCHRGVHGKKAVKR
jgi:hypothetical protein